MSLIWQVIYPTLGTGRPAVYIIQALNGCAPKHCTCLTIVIGVSLPLLDSSAYTLYTAGSKIICPPCDFVIASMQSNEHTFSKIEVKTFAMKMQ